MKVSHDHKSGRTRIDLTWTETRQFAAGSGLTVVQRAVKGAVQGLPRKTQRKEVK